MYILSTQILCLVCLFISMVGMFFLPYCWIGRQPNSFGGTRYQTGLSLANCLSGGVFLATFFVGLMPEVRQLFSDVLETNEGKSQFPVTEFVIFIGFLLALAIEQCVLNYQEKCSPYYSTLPTRTTLNSSQNPKESTATSSFVDYDSDSNDKAIPIVMNRDSVAYQSCLGGNTMHSHGAHSHADVSTYVKGESGIRIGMLMTSLGVHSLFEGLALGLQTDVPLLVNLVIGVAVHELLVAFAMGVNVARLKLPTKAAFKLAVIFAASIPVGQLIGLSIGYHHSTTTVAVSAVLQGLSAGTFIHVTFLEVIPAEFQESGFRMLKVFTLGLGFVLLLLCTVALETFLPLKE